MTPTNMPLLPITQATADDAFDKIFAPWIKDMGLTDFVIREGFCALRLPRDERLEFNRGAICGQAMMAAIDTAASMAVSTQDRIPKGTAYQHTHFLRPAINDDLIVEATVKRFGKASAYVDCNVVFRGSGELVAHAVLEFAF